MGNKDLGIYLNIGKKIKDIRKQRGFTQKDFAQLLRIPVTTYANYENGNRTPKTDMIEKIASALDVSVIELMTGEMQAQYYDLEDLADTVKQDMIDSAESPEEYEAAIKTKRSDIQIKMLLDNIQKEKIHKLNSSFLQLNEKGQQKAIERVQELTEIPRYQKDKNA